MAASVTLRWDPSGPATDGYRLFARKSGQAYNYSQPDWEGAGVTGTLNHLDGQTEYYIVVRAYKGSIESADSNEVHYMPPAATMMTTACPMTGKPASAWIPGSMTPTATSIMTVSATAMNSAPVWSLMIRGVGAAPLKPELLFPKSDAQVERNPLLDAGDFSDADGDAHIATQWQVEDNGSEILPAGCGDPSLAQPFAGTASAAQRRRDL